jgi:polyhydroxybutyrate depolymerase
MRLGVFAFALAACGNAPNGGPVDASPIDTSKPIDAAPDAGPCGMRAGMRGKTSRTVHIASLDRTYVVYLPPNDDPHTPVPLVYVHHGYTMSGQIMYDITGYPALADTEHIALAFPDGQGNPATDAPWNVGTDVCNAIGGFQPPLATGDDFAFLDAMRSDIAQDQCIDLQHIYVTGFSMGGYFSHHAGCMRSDVRAVAPHSGGTHALDQCVNAKEPIIIFHGKADGVIPLGCDDPTATAQNVEASAKAWAEHNGCGATTTTTAVHNGTCYAYDGCPTGGQVTLCTFDAMGHCWAGGENNVLYECPDYEPATQLEWNFFKTYAW